MRTTHSIVKVKHTLVSWCALVNLLLFFLFLAFSQTIVCIYVCNWSIWRQTRHSPDFCNSMIFRETRFRNRFCIQWQWAFQNVLNKFSDFCVATYLIRLVSLFLVCFKWIFELICVLLITFFGEDDGHLAENQQHSTLPKLVFYRFFCAFFYLKFNVKQFYGKCLSINSLCSAPHFLLLLSSLSLKSDDCIN